MTSTSTEGDRFILQGDPVEAKLLVQSAYGLVQGLEDDPLAEVLLAEAEEEWLADTAQVLGRSAADGGDCTRSPI